MLKEDGFGDYVLESGSIAWITVGDKSVRICDKGDGVDVMICQLGEEDCDPVERNFYRYGVNPDE